MQSKVNKTTTTTTTTTKTSLETPHEVGARDET
jgi:hypothetical protein